MLTVTLKSDDGTRYVGRLPSHLGEAPLLPYCQLVKATTVPERIAALAALVGVPAQPLLDDVDHFAELAEAAPFLFDGELPPSGELVAEFTHAGRRYTYVGGLGKLTAGQLEALYNVQRAHAAAPLLAGPAMLAILYNPKDATPEQYRDAAEAFATLPLSVAWPTLESFGRSSLPRLANILHASALSAQARGTVQALEQALTAGVSPIWWRRLPRWLALLWLRNVRKML